MTEFPGDMMRQLAVDIAALSTEAKETLGKDDPEIAEAFDAAAKAAQAVVERIDAAD